MAALGVYALLLRPRTRPAFAFGLFAISYGLAFVMAHVGVYFGHAATVALLPHPYEPVRLALRVVACVGIVLVAASFPRPLAPEERRLLRGPIVLALLGGTAAVGAFVVGSLAITGSGLSALTNAVFALSVVGLWATLHLFALRHASAPDPEMRRALALAYAALLLYPGFIAGSGVNADESTWLLSPFWAFPLVGLLASVLLAVVWLRQGARGIEARRTRDLALLTVAVPLAGILYTALDLDIGGIGLTRTASVVILAYAILRLQLLGIDVKVRWAISKSTLAAAFIAAFFLASEGAQLLLGEENQWVGLLGAGALVFALAPLQRAAERLAERAVPVAAAPVAAAARNVDAREDLLRAYVAAARDGRITHDEEIALARLATRLGFDAATVLEVRREALAAAQGGAE